MNDVVKSVSIENLINQRNALVERFEKMCELADESAAIFGAVGIDHWDSIFSSTFGSSRFCEGLIFQPRENRKALFNKRIDAKFWDTLVKETGVFSQFDRETRENWWKSVNKLETFPFEKETIFATIHELAMKARSGEFMENGLVAVFKKLSWDYKTNLPVKFGKRIICDYVFELTWQGRSLRARFNYQDKLADLDRAFRTMDGQPELDHRNDIIFNINKAFEDGSTNYQNEYFAIKGFKKGTCHISFLRPDLVQLANRIIAKHFPNALPAA